PDNTPDTARPTPDQVSTQPAPDNTPDTARPTPDQVSTQPAPDNTPDTARPTLDQVSTQPTPDASSPHPDAAPASHAGPSQDSGPAQDPAPASRPNSPAPDAPSHPDSGSAPQQAPPAAPGPVAGNPPSNTDGSPHGDNSGNGSANGDNSGTGTGGRPATPPVSMPSQGAPVQHSPSGPPIGQRDPSPGDPMPHVGNDDNPTVAAQSTATATAPPPAPHTADPGTSAPSTPHQSSQNTPQSSGPVVGMPTTMSPQGGPAAPGTGSPQGGTPSNRGASAPPNRRPDSSQPIRDVTQQPTPDRPAYNPRLDGPRRDAPTTPPSGNRRPDGTQAVHDPTQQRRPEAPPHDPRLDGPRPNQNQPNQQTPQDRQTQQPPQDRQTPQPPQDRQTPQDQQQQPRNDRPDPRRQPSQEHPTNTDPAAGTPTDPSRPGTDSTRTESPTNSADRPGSPSDNRPETSDRTNTPDTAQRPDQSDTPTPTPTSDNNTTRDNTPHPDPTNQDTTPDHNPTSDNPETPDSPNSSDSPDSPDPTDEPTPASETRNRERPGGLEGPTDDHQNTVENTVPKDENGEPQRHPDPDDGNWLHSINDPGPDAPGRNNNCVDTALATTDTYSGNPTAAAHRTPDTNPDGTPSDRGEKNGRDRIENTLGARFGDYGNGRDAFNRLENTLRNNGHGSQAVIITQDSNGRAHAWNAVNHNGKITYVDAQTGQRGNKPLHDGSNGVHAIPLSPDRRPINDRTGDGSGDRRAPAEPAGKHKQEHDGEDEEKPKKKRKRKPPKTPEQRQQEREQARAIAEQPFDSDGAEGVPGYNEEQGTDHTHDGMLGDESQQRLRQTHSVEQTNLRPVVDAFKRWANPDKDTGIPPLIEAIKVIQRDGALDAERMNHVLPGYDKLSHDQQMGALAGLGRLSNAVHEAHSVGTHPIAIDGVESEGLRLHNKHDIRSGEPLDPAQVAREYAARQNVPAGDDMTPEEREKREEKVAAEKARINRVWREAVNNVADSIVRPDMSGKNYAVLEVRETVGDTTRTHYVIDSSVPPGEGAGHSEPVGGEWVRRVQEEHPGRFEVVSLYTEFEPCGKSQDTGGANCSHYISEDLERDPGEERSKHRDMKKEGTLTTPDQKSGVKIYYGIAYRMGDMQNSPHNGEAVSEETRAQQIAAKDKRNAEMNRLRGELLRAWVTAVDSTPPAQLRPYPPSAADSDVEMQSP
ncbi:toxin glutamine deamidase domain-containing protein, partial [Streptomyces sp. NPDC048483]|uniref:toxin glutamine deamidase domain-containing protein n=1 Tax=Streptomyces sp. NPDC048483 TaxID=3154927 RepID=UPI00341670AF